MELYPFTISIAEAVELVGLGKTHLYKAIAAGDLKVKKSGRRTLLETAELRRFVESLPLSNPAAAIDALKKQ